MSAFKISALFCAAAVLMVSAHAAEADDLLSLAGKWSGEFTSDVDGYEGVMQAELKLSPDGQLMGILPYIEQNNVYNFRVASADVNNDGKAEIITGMKADNGVTLFMQIDAVYLPAMQAGESPMLVGTYEIFRLDSSGNTHKVDFGTFGIIAILIG